jgi:prepilin-type N-terminal cleavage/methylation domain-containing protein
MRPLHRIRVAGKRTPHLGLSLIEMLCVTAILCILASLLLPAVSRAYLKVRGMTDEWDAGDVLAMISQETRGYCAGHPKYEFPTKSDFVEKCDFEPRPRRWVRFSETEFVPFGFFDDTNKVVLTFHVGRKHAYKYTLTKGELTIIPQPR